MQDYFSLWKSYWFKQHASDWGSRWLYPQHMGRLNCSFLVNKNFKSNVKSSMLTANFVHWTDFFSSRKYHSFIFKFHFCYEFKHNILSPASQRAVQSQNEKLKAAISIWLFAFANRTETHFFYQILQSSRYFCAHLLTFHLFPATEDGICTITLEKSAAGLGFSLEGGKGSIHGDKPIIINRIFKGKNTSVSGWQVLCW